MMFPPTPRQFVRARFWPLAVLTMGVLAGVGGVRADSAASRPVGAGRKDARQAYQRGQYSLAEGRYRKGLTSDASALEAAIGLADVLRMTGKYQDALDVLRHVASAGRENPTWRRAQAGALRDVGQYAEALEHIAQADALEPDNAQTILLRGQLLETLGREDEALAVYGRMEAIIENDDYRRNAQALVALGEILDRYAILTGRKASDQAKNILHNYFQEAYQKVDPGYWQANVAAGKFLLTKHQAKGAREEFQHARKRNPRIPAVYAGLGLLELQTWNFTKCLALARKALAINPHHDEALYLQAACYMQWRKFDKAIPPLEKILAVNPNHIEALSLLTAAYLRQRQPDKAKPYIERIAATNPHCATLPHTIGYWFMAGRQFDDAETYLQEAVALAPRQAGPLASLGELYMQTGEEAKARETLEQARALDDYRRDVHLYLQIAHRLKDFAVKETEHFIIKVDPKHDLVLLDLAAEYLESIYDEVTGDYSHAPRRKTMIEILPTQSEFSARIAGRAWIPTVGACTGRVIALAAPSKARGALGLHNWAQVLRHEFAHTVTLEATDNRIPHWLTEACAVWQQKDKRAFKYVKVLVGAVRRGRFVPVRDIDWAFIRPKYRGQRMLAYAQSEWMLDYIIRTHGFATLHKMLDAFGRGLSQKQVFEKPLGLSEKQFDKNFLAWARQIVKEWGFDPSPPPQVKQTARAVKKSPNDARAHARHALALLRARKPAKARAAAEKALQLSKNNLLALRVLANLHYNAKRYNRVIELCDRIEAGDSTTTTAPNLLARCYLARKNWARAIESLDLLQKRQPMDAFSYQQFAKLYIQLGQPAKALPNLIYLHQHTMNDPKYARQIAEIYRTLGKPESALAYFREVTYINPYDPSAYKAMAALHLRGKQYDRARAAAVNLTLLKPKDAQVWTYLATIRYRIGLANNDLGELQQARKDALRAGELAPGAAAQVLRFIDAAIKKFSETVS